MAYKLVTIHDKSEMFHASVTLYVGDKDENKQGRWTGSLAVHDEVEASKYEES